MQGLQLVLPIHAPKTHQSRRDKLEAFKKSVGIWTHREPYTAKSDHPWAAMLLNEARERCAGYNSEKFNARSCAPEDLIFGYVRLLEEGFPALLVTGETERSAIERLLQSANVEGDLRAAVRMTLYYQANR